MKPDTVRLGVKPVHYNYNPRQKNELATLMALVIISIYLTVTINIKEAQMECELPTGPVFP